VSRCDFIDGDPEQVNGFLRAFIEGTGYWKDPAKKDLITGALARFIKLDRDKEREQLAETFRYYGKIFPTRPYPSADGMEYALEILKTSRPDAINLQARDYILNRFIDELDKEGFLAQVLSSQ